MVSQPCDVPQKKAMTLHNLWITHMGQWYFKLLALPPDGWGLPQGTERPENATNHSKQLVNVQQFVLACFSVINILLVIFVSATFKKAEPS